jgi:hypothetical protein
MLSSHVAKDKPERESADQMERIEKRERGRREM